MKVDEGSSILISNVGNALLAWPTAFRSGSYAKYSYLYIYIRTYYNISETVLYSRKPKVLKRLYQVNLGIYSFKFRTRNYISIA